MSSHDGANHTGLSLVGLVVCLAACCRHGDGVPVLTRPKVSISSQERRCVIKSTDCKLIERPEVIFGN